MNNTKGKQSKEYRLDFIEEIMEFKAYSNRGRDELISTRHDSQELLDLFRVFLRAGLVEKTNEELPEGHDQRWDYVHEEWRCFKLTYVNKNINDINIQVDFKKK